MSPSPPESPSLRRIGDAVPAHPVIVAVPHAGRAYPPELLEAARVPVEALEALEDRHADQLASQAVLDGATVFVAQRARAWIDLNRGEREIDRTMVAPRPSPTAVDDNARVRAGLGLVPRRGMGGAELWRRPIASADVARRIAEDHRPWHGAIGAALLQARARFGIAILLDLHSMPPLRPSRDGPAAQLVVGDRHGLSAERRFRDRMLAEGRRADMRIVANAPYAGGHALDRHGRPDRGIHALQLEVDRALYLDVALRDTGPGLARMQAMVAGMVRALADEALDGALMLAAE